EQFHDELYFRRACSTYQFLIEQYGSSPMVRDAAHEYIRIMREKLGNEVEAINMEKRFHWSSPESPAAQTAAPQTETVEKGVAILIDLKHYTGANYSRIVLNFDREVNFKRDRISNPDRLYFDFENTVASRKLM